MIRTSRRVPAYDEEDGIHKESRACLSNSTRSKLLVGSTILMLSFIIGVTVLSSAKSSTSSDAAAAAAVGGGNGNGSGGFTSASSCKIENCSLEVIALLRNGEKHTCKDFCSKQVVWKITDNKTQHPDTPLYGIFSRSGFCEKHSELGWKGGGTTITASALAERAGDVNREDGESGHSEMGMNLIPRRNDGIPDFSSLVDSMQGQSILLIGDSIFKENLEIWPMVMNHTKVTTDNYIYVDDKNMETIETCDLDFKKKVNTCKEQGGERFECNCTSVTTVNVGHHTTIQFAFGYGLEFENAKGERQVYGLPNYFNIIKPALYQTLARTSSAVVVTMGVVTHLVDHDVDGYRDLLKYMIQDWPKPHPKIVFGLTMPQHFATRNPSSSFLDEERENGRCVEVAPARHWSDTLAQEVLHNNAQGVDLVDTFPYLSQRGYFHSNQGGDCAAWCLGYDMYYAFWKVISAAIAK